MAEYATCTRCGTTTILNSSNSKMWWGTCKECKNKVIKEKPKK